MVKKKAAGQGHLEAQFNLGVWYGLGDGVLLNNAEAFKWYLKAAKQGSENAKIIIGRRYYSGVGVDKNLAQGFSWLSMGDSAYAKLSLEAIKKIMTTSEIEEGKSLARQCRESSYKNCE
jgi:hypothetical protein